MTETAAPAIRFPPPLVFIGFLLLGPLVERLIGLPPLPIPWWIGAVIAALGLALVAVASGVFMSHGEDPKPWTPNKAVVDTGIYAYSRNPMYLGMAIAHFGLAIVLHSVLALLFLPIAISFIRSKVIAREEAYLLGVFGEAYAEYCGRVRRWF